VTKVPGESRAEGNLMRMARAERADLADFLATLTPQQWDTPSLCAGWTVKDVAAHMISYEELGTVGLLKRFAKGRIVRANQVGVDEFGALSPQQLLEFLRNHLQPQGLSAVALRVVGSCRWCAVGTGV
jgi:uncharacterized protein (TIGR03083 family)